MIEKYIPKFMDILYEDDIRSKVTFNEIRDAFHTNQIVSKNDAIIGFSSLPKLKQRNVLYIGSWLGLLTRYLCEAWPDYNFSQLDYDSRIETVSKRFLIHNKNHKNYFVVNASEFNDFSNYTTVMNLSTEHMDNIWFENLSIGTEVVIQSNNYIINDHINISNNMQELKNKYPLTEIYYENTIELNVYNRFTLVGKK